MALPATDEFTRANANPIGGNWSTTGNANALQLVGNAVDATDTNTNAAHWSADTFNNDQYCLVAITTVAAGVSGGPTVRAGANGANPAGYLWFYPGTANTMRLYRWNGDGPNSYTQIGSDYSVTVNAASVLKISVSGTTLTPAVDGVNQTTQADSTWASGSAGLQIYGTGAPQPPLDNWEGGNVGPPPPGIVYAEDLAGTTAASAAWVDTAIIPAASFTAFKRYLIIAHIISTFSTANGEANSRLVHGTTPTVFDDASLAHEGLADNQEHEQFWLFDYTQPGTTERVKIQISSSGTATHTCRIAQILAINLDDVGASGTDYFFNEDLTDYTMTATPTAKAVTASFTPNGTDRWLFIGHMIEDVVGITTPIGFELYDSVAGVLNSCEFEGEDGTNDFRGVNLYWAGVPTNAARTLAVRPFNSGSAIMLASRVIAINLSRFAQSASAFDAAEVDPATTPTYTTLATVSPTPTNTGNWVYLGFSNQDVNQTTTDWETRIQVNADGGGLVSDPAYPTTAPSIDNWDATDEVPHAIFNLVSLTAGAARDINWDCRQVAGTTGRMEDNGLVAFSVALATGGLTGTLSQTLGALTISAAGTVETHGTASPTLGALTAAATGTVSVSGSLSSTLGAATLAGTATVEIAGSLSATLGALTLSATGTVGVAGIEGSLSQTLGAATLAGTGAAAIAGQASASLGALTLAGTGTVSVSGTLSAGLGSATLSATATLGIAGTASDTLGAATLSATGTMGPITGSLSATLGNLTLAGTAGVAIAGSLSQTLGAATLAAIATTGIAGTLAGTLGTATLAGTGTLAIAGTATLTLGVLTLAGVGSVSGPVGSLDATLGTLTLVGEGVIGAAPITGDLNQTLGTLAVSATATAGIAGTLASTLGVATLAGTGTLAIDGTATPTLGALTSTGAATVSISGSLSDTLGALTLDGQGVVGEAPLEGTLSQTLGALAVSATGTMAIAGSASQTLGAASLAGTATLSVTGTATPPLGELVATATATVSITGTATVTLGALTLVGVGASSIDGGMSSTLGALTLVGTGELSEPPIEGVLLVTLGDLSLTATGTVTEGIIISGELDAVLGNVSMVSVGGILLGTVLCEIVEEQRILASLELT